jgi:hypothetical protein
MGNGGLGEPLKEGFVNGLDIIAVARVFEASPIF